MSQQSPNPSPVDEILWQSKVNEARLHSERTSFFLVATAFLVTGFAVLRQAPSLGIEFIPPAVGIAFSVLHFININYGQRVHELWDDIIRQNGGDGAYLLDKRDELFRNTWWLKPWPGLGIVTRNIAGWAFPMLFVAMWVAFICVQTADP